jgi:hypothetical protein
MIRYRKKIIVSVLVILSIFSIMDCQSIKSGTAERSDAVTPLRVLFIGNSLTYYNNLPSQVTNLAVDLGAVPPLQADSVTISGARLDRHLTGTAVDTIRKGGWHVVVLQGHSMEPLYDPDGFFSAAALLAQEARSAGADVVFFETWAYAPRCLYYLNAWSGGNFKEMQARLRKAYTRAAEDAGGRIAPVGDVWEVVMAEHEEIKLHSSDGIHPTECGSYLAACVWTALLTDCDIRDATWLPDSGVTKSEAELLRAYAYKAMEKQ